MIVIASDSGERFPDPSTAFAVKVFDQRLSATVMENHSVEAPLATKTSWLSYIYIYLVRDKIVAIPFNIILDHVTV